MEIILKTDISKLGKALDIVTVKDGYARNYLFPRKMAMPATKANKQLVLTNRSKLEAMFLAERSDAQAMVAKLEAASVSISRKVIEGEKLYGSVSNGDIAENLKNQGFKIEKRNVALDEPIKQLGVYTVLLKLNAGVEARVKVWVVQEEE
jgi:large subunit ribosomal protein L9